MKYGNRISGNTLLLTIVIALILAVLCSSVILMAYYSRQSMQRMDFEQRVSSNLESAINLVLADTTVYCAYKSETLDLFGENQDSVIISQDIWGIFQMASIKSFRGDFSQKRNFIYGPALPDYMNACIYLADHQRGLSLIGDTKLKGNIYISKAGIKPAYIDQRTFSYHKPVEGEIKYSEKNLPALNEKILEYYKSLFRPQLNYQDNSIILEQSDSLFQSFSDTVLHIYSRGKIFLENIKLEGHIMVVSDSSIEVNGSAVLNKVILIAPTVKFNNRFLGDVQVFAEDSIIIGQDCHFQYPSSLVLLESNSLLRSEVLSIGKKSSFAGIIIAESKKENENKPLVHISTEVIIDGIVYVNGYLDPGNLIYGIVLTDYFIHRAPSVIYENYLVDIEINRNLLSKFFIGSSIFSKSLGQNLIQWTN